MKKPSVTLNPGASKYEASNEKIIEFSFPGTVGKDGQGPLGGLISFRVTHNGVGIVEVYRCDEEVNVRFNKEAKI